jgi:hypothetical protein
MISDFLAYNASTQKPSVHNRRGKTLGMILIFIAGTTAIGQTASTNKSAGHLAATSSSTKAVPRSPVIATEIKIVDSQGRPRITMSANSDSPMIRFLQLDGSTSLEILLDSAGRPTVKLANPDLKGPVASLAIDDKGTHVKFDRPGGASSYLFLNNSGESGIVFVDGNGVRRLNVLVGPGNDARIERFGSDGKPISEP